jgi:hypothetical protein
MKTIKWELHGSFDRDDKQWNDLLDYFEDFNDDSVELFFQLKDSFGIISSWHLRNCIEKKEIF